MPLGLPDLDYSDLHTAEGLARLHARFLEDLTAHDAALAARFAAYRRDPTEGPEGSALLIAVAEYVSRFVAAVFGVTEEQEALRARLRGHGDVLRLKNELIHKRVLKKGGDKAPAEAFVELGPDIARLLSALGHDGAAVDTELAFARAVVPLLDALKFYERKPTPKPDEADERTRGVVAALRLSGLFVDAAEGFAADAELVKSALSRLERWSYARSLHPRGQAEIAGWISYKLPHKLDHQELVQIRRPRAELPEQMAIGDAAGLRRRDGFGLTDERGSARQVLHEIDYCIICHERQKDSCSKGLKEKAPREDGSAAFKKNPLGIPLHGCPLEEHISEMHVLEGRGDAVAALAMICVANPMLPGTGHRICNDCMKACIYQAQEPVNIPMVETGVLTDVLALPYGFEIWSLLTRWNPLNVQRPHAAPYNGKNVLVVGMGPAGYTLAHHLLNEGFGVVGVDGLKIEPLPERWQNEPVKDWRELCSALDERLLAGFGGVSEYGITVRWDKNFLTLLYLNLLRRRSFRVYGGVRFGGTITVEDAWRLGFDHVALAAGAGRPTVIGLEQNLLPGMRSASDFLMALQLTGAFKKDSLASLQVRLPAVVIGGGLTAIDTATELAAYYPVQVEKLLERFEALPLQKRFELDASLPPGEREAVHEALEHGRAVVAERARARAAGEAPNFVPLVDAWGGVSLVYRKTLQDSPAYRLNHEEVHKSLEEGIRYVECLDPKEALADEHGWVRAVRFERQRQEDGRWRGTGEQVLLPARTVCVAAGTAPNITLEREAPGTLALDSRGHYFQGHLARRLDDGTIELTQAAPTPDLSREAGFFTSYLSADRTRCISFYGDNHPQYAGSVVKAMASAKDGYPRVAALFAAELTAQRPHEQAARDAAFAAFVRRLDDSLVATVAEVKRLTPTIVEVVVRAPLAAAHFSPGQFYRLQSYEALAREVKGTRLSSEGLALTGAWVDKERGLLSLIVLEMGASSRLCAALRPGERVVCMGPTGTPTEIPTGEKVVLVGGGLGNAVLFSIAQALKAAGNEVLYFAGYRDPIDVFKMEDIEAGTDQVIWASDKAPRITPRRPQDTAFLGNIVQAMEAYARGELGEQRVLLSEIDRLIVIGSDRMMAAVKEARHGVLAPFIKEQHAAVASVNSPMQCMMKEICAQCLQRHVGPDGRISYVFSCMNQDQPLDAVDFGFLNARLRMNAAPERLADAWLAECFALGEVPRV